MSLRDNTTPGDGKGRCFVRASRTAKGPASALAIAAANDKTRELQRTLYRAAKADPQRRFHALYDKVHRRDVLERAWGQVRRNRGAAGIDRTTLADVERYGVDRLLDELAADLRSGSYRPLPARRVFIPKPGSLEQRPLSIPAVRDRVAQAALKTVIEPIFEADFLPCSFGFRPRKSAHDALQILIDECWRGRRWVVETDIAQCYEAIPHSGLLSAIEERICDRRLLKLVRAMLRSGVMEDGAIRHSVTGTPQGGVASPLLANVYLHRLDREWRTRGRGSRCCERSWPNWASSPSKPRRGSCTYMKEVRGWTSSASTTAGCAPVARRLGTSPSSPVGPQPRRCSTPATASGS